MSSAVRTLFNGFGDMAEECCRCFCCCFAVGPALMLFGLFVLINAAGNPRKSGINAYNEQITYWGEAGGGLTQWDLVFPSTIATLTMATFDRRVGLEDQNKTSMPVTLDASTAATPLDDSDPSMLNYTDALYFSGDLPDLGTAWPSSDPWALISATSPTVAFDPLKVQLFECREMEQPGRMCPYPPPPAPVGGVAAAPEEAMSPWAGTAPAQLGNNSATARRLLQFSSDVSDEGQVQCRSFQRQLRYITALPLVATPPRLCPEKVNATCTGNWTLLLDNCNLEYGMVVVDVSEETYMSDRRSTSEPAWCSDWGALLPAPNVTAVTLRSAADPYIAAGVITNCQYNFGPTAGQYAQLGVNIMAVGAALTAMLCCCLACLVYSRPDTSPMAAGPTYYGSGGIGVRATPRVRTHTHTHT